MTFPWRRNRGGVKKAVLKRMDSDLELRIPTHFRCPISLDLMKDPVTLSTGITYDREGIEKWVDSGYATCPVTNQVLRSFDIIPNHSIRKMIQDWCVENKSHGVERIPTPRIPISAYEVAEICSRMDVATRNQDVQKCHELLKKIKNLVKENERNKRCLVSNGIGDALANSFESFSRVSISEHADLLKEILFMLTWAFPIDQESVSKLKSKISLGCITWFLKSEDLSSRQNAISLLRELIFSDLDFIYAIAEIEGIEEMLLNIVKVQICPRATKACLVVIHLMMLLPQEKSGKITFRFVQMGLISLILEILVEGDDKSTWEKALAVLDGICNTKEGRVEALGNALTIPILVKKILRISDAGTAFCISIIWNLCLGENNEEALVEAGQLGAFQKLLVVLQVGSCEKRKEATELLKVMNLYRDKLDCVDSSMGFKYLKRST